MNELDLDFIRTREATTNGTFDPVVHLTVAERDWLVAEVEWLRTLAKDAWVEAKRIYGGRP